MRLRSWHLAVIVMLVGSGLVYGYLPGALALQNPPPWTAEIATPNVPLGGTIFVTVAGPAAGSFEVNVTAFPYNDSPVLFSQTYTLPPVNSTTNSTSGLGPVAYTNVTISTTQWAITSYFVKVVAGDTPVGNFVVYVGTGVPDDLTAVLQGLSFNNTLLLERLALTDGTLDHLETEVVIVLVACVIEFFVFFIALFIVHTHFGERRLPSKVKAAGHAAIMGQQHVVAEEGGIRQNSYVVHPNPNRVFRSQWDPACLECTRIDHTRAEMVRHLQVVHHIDEPAENVHYQVWTPTVERIRSMNQPRVPGRALQKAQRANRGVDLSQLPEWRS